MKMTAFIILITCLHVSATGFAQKVTLSVKNTPLKQVFSTLLMRTGVSIIYDESWLVHTTPVTIDVKDATLLQVLDICVKNQPITYAVEDNDIVIMPIVVKQSSLPADTMNRVTGYVSDEKGQPLPNVSITIKGTRRGTTSDPGGHFTIQVPNRKSILLFSFIGFESRELPVTSNMDAVNILLVQANAGLNEVVVTGYATQKKSNLTGAVEAISGKVIASRPQGNVGQMLQGVSPGLNISTNNSGGEPDATMNFNIRGMGSPFILVDGMPMNINQLNPNDIESISVLKDASSAAIYGAYAPYGVILITTKKGGSTDGKPNLSYNSNVEWATPIRLPKPANGLEFANAWNDATRNSDMPPFFSDDIVEKIKQYMNDPENTPGTAPDPLDPSKWGKHEYANASTDWYKALIKKWSFRQKHNLTVDGGKDGLTYYLSAGLYDHGGQMKYGNEQYQRYNIDAKINTKITKWMQVNFLTKYARSKSDYPNDGYGLNRTVMWHDLTRRYATDPLKYPNGEYSEMSRVNVYEQGGRDVQLNNELWLRLESVLEPVKNWLIKGDYSWKNANLTNTAHHALVQATGPDGGRYVAFDTRTPNDIAQTSDVDNYWTYNISTSYEKKLNDHNVKVLLGYQREYQYYGGVYGLKNKLITDNVPAISTATGDMTTRDYMSHWATEGAFFRVNYDYKEKYLLEMNARRNGTSRFEDGKRSGFFPSVSSGYRISAEPFWQPIKPYINYLKLRASYGSLGNQNVANYLYMPIMPITQQVYWINGETSPVGVGAPGIASAGLTWETVRTMDVGLDATLFNNRLDVSFDYFKRRVFNMLGTSYPLPAVLGTSVPLENNAEKLNTGWETSLGWNDAIGEWKYNVRFTISDYKVQITKWNNPNKTLSSNYEGQREGDIWGYTSNGLFQSQDEIAKHASQSLFYANWHPGDVRYEDLNGDGVINYGDRTLNDHGDLSVIGNATPRYSYAVNLGLAWKGIDMSMFWMGVGKRDVWFNGNVFWGQLGDVWQNSTFKEHLDYWSESNTGGYYPRPYFSGEGAKNREVSSLYLQNAAFLRLKSLQVGYTFPDRLLSKASIKKVRVYFTGENLLTFSKIKGMFDPEGIFGTYGQGKIYPLSSIVSFGVNINL
ncbi:TonB-dependent receptor [Chitinophaga sp. MM2321]|uniref:TonB-dependent receptor n=1 Tax=Chitinophaga sp. MM2321 TaxID=3137178 RepID=UPI0032D5751B